MDIISTSNDPWFNLEGYVRSGCYAILSVHPDIRLRTKTSPLSRRGHFVFVYDVGEIDGETVFLLNNPAGFQSNNSQIGMAVSAERLAQVSSGDGIIIKSRFSRLIGE